MLGYKKEQISLTMEQKELLDCFQEGLFLEYFDLMLYVYKAVLLYELFFQSTNSLTFL